MEAAAEETGGGGGHTTGRKLVPWSSWAEWRFVRDAIFSPYPDPDAALRRVRKSSSCKAPTSVGRKI
jgi:ribosomal biogenesis protein LAS1